jgi:hypothetical protein
MERVAIGCRGLIGMSELKERMLQDKELVELALKLAIERKDEAGIAYFTKAKAEMAEIEADFARIETMDQLFRNSHDSHDHH